MSLDREKIFKVRHHLDRLRDELRVLSAMAPVLAERLRAYEATGDHNHGGRVYKTDEECPGGDCYVARTRTLLAALADVRR